MDLLKFLGLSNDFSVEERIVTVFGHISKVYFVLFLFGFLDVQPELLLQINYVLKVLISVYIIYRFNTWRKENVTFTNLDRKLVVSLSVYNLLLSFSDLIFFYIEQIREEIKDFFKGWNG